MVWIDLIFFLIDNWIIWNSNCDYVPVTYLNEARKRGRKKIDNLVIILTTFYPMQIANG